MDVVAGVHHLIHAADVVAVLVAGDGVVEAVRGLDADALEVRDDVAGALAGVAGLASEEVPRKMTVDPFIVFSGGGMEAEPQQGLTLILGRPRDWLVGPFGGGDG